MRGENMAKKLTRPDGKLSRRNFLHQSLVYGAVTSLAYPFTPSSSPARSQTPGAAAHPNFIVIYCDNLGYGDVGCFGSKLHRTPHIDNLARQGMRFTDFYSTSGVCTPSRASLMTGCYPRRVNMHTGDNGIVVLRPISHKGLNPEEITIAEVLKAQGYTTACIGKWHLGDQPEFLPTRQGFDYFLGIPYSDDMTRQVDKSWPPLPLMENEKVIDAPVDRNLLTQRYTARAIKFIKENKDHPFFLYLPHATPGSTKAPFVGENFQGKSANGPWGDSVEELDWSTGEILKTLNELNLDKRTLIVWTSDNGAPRRNPPQGLNLPLKGWGYTTSEGGQRIPCIMRWPGKIPPGTICQEISSTMDLLPTFALLAGTKPPQDRIIDGHDIRPLMFGSKGGKSPYEAFYYYHIEQLQAVRSGKWKLYLPLKATPQDRRYAAKSSPARLYDLQADLSETTNLAPEHPEVVQRLLAYAQKARQDLGDLGRPGKNQRPAGFVSSPTPRISKPNLSSKLQTR